MSEQVRVAERILSHFGDGEVVAAYLSGSSAAGLANTRSDLDLYVVVKRADFLFDGQVRAGRVFTVPWRSRIDIDVIPVADMEMKLSRASEANFVLEDLQSQTASLWSLLTDVSRLRIGTPVAGIATWQRWVDEIDVDAFRKLYMSHFAAAMLGQLEDAAGAVESGDLATGLLSSFGVVLSGAEVLLATANDFYPSSKHILRRIARQESLSAVAGRLLELLHPGITFATPPSVVEDVVRARCYVATQLVSTAMLDAWDHPGIVLQAPPIPPSRDGTRNPYACLVRTSDEFAAAGAVTAKFCDEAEARLWTGLCGTDGAAGADVPLTAPDAAVMRRFDEAGLLDTPRIA